MPGAQQGFGFVLWWGLEATAERRWSAWIERLAGEHGGVRFRPHLTLAVGLPDADTARAIASSLLPAKRPRVALVDAEIRPDYFQRLVLAVRPHATLEAARRVAERASPVQLAGQAPPHLSLLYSEGRSHERLEAEKSRLRGKLPTTAQLDRILVLECPRREPSSWVEIANLPVG